jgi:hypothetical protein
LFAHSHGQIHDEVRVRHEAPHFGGDAQRTFAFRERNGFEPWSFDAFTAEDGDSDGIYSPSWGARILAYWASLARSAPDYLALHRESHARRARRFGPQAAVDGLEVLISTAPERGAFLELLTAELARQGVSFVIDDGPAGDGDTRARLAARATARYVTFMDDDVWPSHNYGELVADAIANNAGAVDAILHDAVTTDGAGRPSPTHFSFEREPADLPDCRLRAPDHSMVWRREIALNGQAASWARIRGLLRFHEGAAAAGQ